MKTMAETATDIRIDELAKRVDFGFEQVDRRVAQFESGVDRGFNEATHRFDRAEADCANCAPT